MPTGAVSAAALLREARLRAGLSQTELARRAGVTQSVVSAYETGTREPSLPTLVKLIGAAGKDLDIRVRARAVPSSKLHGPLGRRVRRHRNDLVATAGRRGATNLRVFGSVARGEESAGSDIDLLADLPEDMGLFGFIRLRKELGEILGANVDLVPGSDLKPGIREEVEADQVAL